MAYPLPQAQEGAGDATGYTAMGNGLRPLRGVPPRSLPDDEPVPLVGPTPEFEEGLVSSEELRVLLGQDEDEEQG